jgi:hypothetical protein
MATPSIPHKKISTHSVLPPPKNFRLEQENNAKMNLYRFHIRPSPSSIATPPAEENVIVNENENVPPVVVVDPITTTSTVNPIETIIKEEEKEEEEEVVVTPPIVDDSVNKIQEEEEPPKLLSEAAISQETVENNDPENTTVKFRLEKVKDEVTGQFRFKLRKVGFNEEASVIAPIAPPPSSPALEEKEKEKEKSNTLADLPIVPRINQRFRVEKTTNGGISKYALKELSEVIPTTPSTLVNDFAEESVNINDIYTPSSNSIQHLSLHRKVLLSAIERNGGIFLLGDEPVGKHFTMKDVLHNSHFLYSTHVLENITIKLITEQFDKAVSCKLSFYYIEPEGSELTPLHNIDLGSLEAGSVARYMTRSIDISTPKKGCVLVSVLEIVPDNELILPRKGKIMLEYNIYATKKMGMQERTIQWSKIEQKSYISL